MFAYQIKDMTCGHCASAITKAVHAVDGGAKVEVDLSRHMVLVDSTSATEGAIGQAIREAGYEAMAVNASSRQAAGARTGGCCCGSGAAAGCGA
ncbi:MAG: heavy-metal-associated domain-containing protein [Aquabacterium sp.]